MLSNEIVYELVDKKKLNKQNPYRRGNCQSEKKNCRFFYRLIYRCIELSNGRWLWSFFPNTLAASASNRCACRNNNCNNAQKLRFDANRMVRVTRLIKIDHVHICPRRGQKRVKNKCLPVHRLCVNRNQQSHSFSKEIN